MFYYRDLMKKHMKKKELEALLEHNKQEIPVGEVIEENIPSRKILILLKPKKSSKVQPRTECWTACVTTSPSELLSLVPSAMAASWFIKVVSGQVS